MKFKKGDFVMCGNKHVHKIISVEKSSMIEENHIKYIVRERCGNLNFVYKDLDRLILATKLHKLFYSV